MVTDQSEQESTIDNSLIFFVSHLSSDPLISLFMAQNSVSSPAAALRTSPSQLVEIFF